MALAEALATPRDILPFTAGADIVILGEVHDNPVHHITQAQIVEVLSPAAIVFEMLDPDEAALLTVEAVNDLDTLASDLDWANSGWPNFEFYAPLFGAAAGRAFGAEVPREDAQAAFASGAAEAFGDGAADFGLTDPLPEGEQAAREAGQLAAHCDALPTEILPGFVEAQRLRDAVLAQTTLQALEEFGGPVVVITGNGHARRDWGMPALLAQAAPEVTVASLGQFEAEPEDPPPFDAWFVTDPVDRPDPCAAFR